MSYGILMGIILSTHLLHKLEYTATQGERNTTAPPGRYEKSSFSYSSASVYASLPSCENMRYSYSGDKQMKEALATAAQNR